MFTLFPSFFKDFIFSYRPKTGKCRHLINLSHSGIFYRSKQIYCDLSFESIDDCLEVCDTSKKVYHSKDILGFNVRYEDGLFDTSSQLLNTLTEDFQMMIKIFPSHAIKKLQSSTPLWINKNITYGPKSRPIKADSMCFHPTGGECWLRKMGIELDL